MREGEREEVRLVLGMGDVVLGQRWYVWEPKVWSGFWWLYG